MEFESRIKVESYIVRDDTDGTLNVSREYLPQVRITAPDKPYKWMYLCENDQICMTEDRSRALHYDSVDMISMAIARFRAYLEWEYGEGGFVEYCGENGKMSFAYKEEYIADGGRHSLSKTYSKPTLTELGDLLTGCVEKSFRKLSDEAMARENNAEDEEESEEHDILRNSTNGESILMGNSDAPIINSAQYWDTLVKFKDMRSKYGRSGKPIIVECRIVYNDDEWCDENIVPFVAAVYNKEIGSLLDSIVGYRFIDFSDMYNHFACRKEEDFTIVGIDNYYETDNC